MPTKIAWTDESWNPVTGCTPISEGCAHCYAKRMMERFDGDFSEIGLHVDRLDVPDHWRKPRRVFVCSMGDLFHETVPDVFIDSVFAVMAMTPRHTYQVLTKRPERMRAYFAPGQYRDIKVYDAGFGREHSMAPIWPLPNVWLGVSVENQARADERIPILLDTPAAVRFVSAEPLLGPLDLKPWLQPGHSHHRFGTLDCFGRDRPDALHWVIVGGESAGPEHRRLVERCVCENLLRKAIKAPDGVPVRCSYCDGTFWRPKAEALGWVHDIRNQCQAAGIPFFFKQWGGPAPKAGGRLLDGRVWEEMPRQEVRA